MTEALNSSIVGPPRGAPLSDMITEIGRWMKEAVDTAVPGLTADAINDAIEDLWMLVVRTVVSELMGGPVSLTLASGTERVQLISIADPTVAPTIAGTGASTFPARNNLYFAISLVTESGTETLITLPSIINSFAPNILIKVTPDAATAAAAIAAGAFGFNVYGANPVFPALPTQWYKINVDPADLNGSWTESAASQVTFDSELNPPPPVYNSTGDNIYYINHLEIQTPDSSYSSWNQADIDSNLMRRAARSLPEVSAYGRFLFDTINGGNLEVRPPVGSTLTPRYFFINKPRRLRFANAPVPMAHIPSGPSYIRFKAISLLKLVAEEYQAASMWASKAQDTSVQIVQSLNRKTAARNNRVTPFIGR